MSTPYYVNLNNDSDRTWAMAVYQTFPDSIGLDSVAWKKTTVPPSGSSGVTWNETYNVALASYRQDNPIGVYYTNQILEADLGTEWKVSYKEGCQQLMYVGNLSPDLGDHIVVHNDSGLMSSPGVGMDWNVSVCKRQILSNASAQFKVTPVFWVGLFRDVQLGEVISSNVEVGPLRLEFDGGCNIANIEVARVGESVVLAPVEYSRS